MTAEENPRVGTPGVSQKNPLNTTNSTRDRLYALAIHGFHLLPLIPGEKRPAITDWEKRATVDPAQLDRWPKGAGVGIACGRSGLVVIDCDSHGSTPPPEWDRPGIRDGVDVFADLWSRHSPNASMFDTFTVTTPSGGLHLYFRAPVGSRTRNRTGLEWQVDVRAHGGYACGPGTYLEQGAYTPSGDPGTLLPLPQWLHDMLAPPEPAQRRPMPVAPPTRSQADRRVAGLLRTVSTAPEGQRNSTLNWAAWQLAQDGLLTQEYATALLHAAETAGLPQAEAVKTIRSAAAPRGSNAQGGAAA
ncbi:bifunctional DNA primase/polymerase [Kocuria marina]|uniref:bifunctional DNA primase/polymerase n=1 Tax=Kocuria marina TaxID=223184 RepID=UPI0034609D49